MIELFIVFICVLWISLYYVEKAARKGKVQVRYGWLAYSFRPLIFFCSVGLLIIFMGTDWRSPFWELMAGLFFVGIGIIISLRSLQRRKEIEEKFISGKIEPTGTESTE